MVLGRREREREISLTVCRTRKSEADWGWNGLGWVVNRADVEGQMVKLSFASFTELRRRLYWALFFSCWCCIFLPHLLSFPFKSKHIYLLNFLFCHLFPNLGQQREWNGIYYVHFQSYICFSFFTRIMSKFLPCPTVRLKKWINLSH